MHTYLDDLQLNAFVRLDSNEAATDRVHNPVDEELVWLLWVWLKPPQLPIGYQFLIGHNTQKKTKKVITQASSVKLYLTFSNVIPDKINVGCPSITKVINYHIIGGQCYTTE